MTINTAAGAATLPSVHPNTAPAPSPPPAQEAMKPPAQHTDDCQLRQRVLERSAPPDMRNTGTAWRPGGSAYASVHYRKAREWTDCACWCHQPTPPPAPRPRRERQKSRENVHASQKAAAYEPGGGT